MRRSVRLVGALLVVLGVAVGGRLAWQMWGTDLQVAREQAQVVEELEGSFSPATNGAGGEQSGVAKRAKAGGPFAVIRIPAFGSDYARPVYEGTDAPELAKGIGYVPDTAAPGGIGNFVTAGHRVTYGKPYNRIHELRPGDRIVVETDDGTYTYSFVKFRITTADDLGVLAPVPDKVGVEATAETGRWITLIACHPQFSARERYVAFAEMTDFAPRAAGVPST
ncbi:MAG: class E sortase [Dermatophilus congolensis]|nr:class E sortase [Dermatophilus congolensis]